MSGAAALRAELFGREARIAAVDVGERKEAGHRQGGFPIRDEESLPGGWPQLDSLLEAGDPELPKDIVVSLVDGEERTVPIGALDQCPGDIVVVVHHEA